MVGEKNPSVVRTHVRAQVAGKVFIHDENRLFIAPLNNLSAGGLFVDRLVSIPEGSRVRVVIKSDQLHDAVQALGKVVRVETDERRGLAVQFTAISKKAREVISKSVAVADIEQKLAA